MDVHGLDLPRLRALAASVELGSLDAAAAALDVTSSAFTQRLQALEAAVGGPVLIRSRPVVATDAGRLLIDLLRQVEGLESGSVRGDSSSPGGSQRPPALSVAVPPELATCALAALIGLTDRWEVTPSASVTRSNWTSPRCLQKPSTHRSTWWRPWEGCSRCGRE